MNRRRGCSMLCSVVLAFLPAVSLAQSINIDFGSAGTAPASSYAAAGLAGAWNTIGVYPSGVRAPLVGLDGAPSAAEIYGIGGTALRVEDDPATNGDDAALMDDMLIGYNDPVDVCIWVEDLVNGQYVVLIYALTPNNASLLHRVRVDNATPGPTMIGGGWPGSHQEGVTYERFLVNVTNGYIGLHSGLYGGGPFESGINAIQIIASATGVDTPPRTDEAAPRIERIYPNPGRGAHRRMRVHVDQSAARSDCVQDTEAASHAHPLRRFCLHEHPDRTIFTSCRTRDLLPNRVLALNASNELVTFNARNPERPRARTTVTNLKTGERLVGIDYRPLTGRLYGVGSTSQVYVIDDDSGFASPIGAPFTPVLNGTEFGVDFNPQADRIRVVSNAGQNLRINPDTGVAINDGPLAYAASDANAGKSPSVVGVAYTNNVARAASTALNDIDSSLDILATQAPPNNGTLNTVGKLGVDTGDVVGFDIVTRKSRDSALAALQVGTNASRLFTINLGTGKAIALGDLLRGDLVRDIAIPFDAPDLQPAYALTPANALLGFKASNASRIRSQVTVTGLQTGENLVGIDFRPATGRMYGVGSTSRVYVIDPITGVAVAIGAGPFTPALSGTEFGVDFNPQVDRLRVVSNTGQNLRINPDTGAVASTDKPLAFATNDRNADRTPNVVGAAYTNNFAGTTSTVLNDIDASLDILVKQSPPNDGTLNTVGKLGVDTRDMVGFDISTRKERDTALAALQKPNGSRLYSVDLDSGKARDRGSIGYGLDVRDIALAPMDQD